MVFHAPLNTNIIFDHKQLSQLSIKMSLEDNECD